MSAHRFVAKQATLALDQAITPNQNKTASVESVPFFRGGGVSRLLRGI